MYLIEEQVNNEKITLRAWDCGGAERFRPLIQQHYQGIKGVIMMYDVTSDDSFQVVSQHNHGRDVSLSLFVQPRVRTTHC